jgi:glycosyltransferase involved in cell wall biosynthesis
VIPTVSVVIPTHNRRELLLAAIASVLRQTDVGFEIVVVDDGSRDGTADAVRSLADARMVILRNEQPIRVAAARNMGAGAARGAWLAFLDDDDLWAPDKLQQQLAAAASTSRRWVYAGVVEIDRRGVLIGGEPPPLPEELRSTLISRNLMPAGSSNVLVSTELFRAVGGFDPELRHLADWDLWLRLTACGLPACVSRPLIAYRRHAGQATLDPHGMIEEGRLLNARHGADLNSIRRWLAWSHLRKGERRLAVCAYTRAAVAGDVWSLARAAVALLHPRPIDVRTGASRNAEWLRLAECWLRPLVDQ